MSENNIAASSNNDVSIDSAISEIKDLIAISRKKVAVQVNKELLTTYWKYQIQQAVSVNLSWSHYCELLSISDIDKRSFYEKECINFGWSIRELSRWKML